MAQKKDTRKIWFVEFPTYRYTQDVLEVARKNGLKVVDSRFKGEKRFKDMVTDKEPTLTLKKEYQPKEKTEDK